MNDEDKFLLNINRIVDVPCRNLYVDAFDFVDCIDGTMRWRSNGDVYDVSWCPEGKCPECEGKGKRTVQLKGRCEVWLNNESIWVINPVGNSPAQVKIGSGTEMPTLLIDQIITAYCAGELPEEIKDQIKEIGNG